MNASFSKKKEGPVEVEYITLSGGFLGKDTVTRPAAAEDRETYQAEYQAFVNPPAPPEDKDAKIAALEAALAAKSEPAK